MSDLKDLSGGELLVECDIGMFIGVEKYAELLSRLNERDQLKKERDTQARQIAELREALTRLRDCDWVITLPDRMDAVRDIARKALEAKHEYAPETDAGDGRRVMVRRGSSHYPHFESYAKSALNDHDCEYVGCCLATETEAAAYRKSMEGKG